MYRPLSFALLLTGSSAAIAQPPPAAEGSLAPLAACAAKAYESYTSGMAAWEKDWARSVAAAKPQLGDAAQLRASAQTLALKRDGLRIRYLADKAPAALDLDESVAALRIFDWPQIAEQDLRESRPDYGTLADQTEQVQQQAESQPQRDELESYFEETFADGSGAAIARKLHATLEQGNTALEACRQAHPLPPRPAEEQQPAMSGDTPKS